MTSKPQFFATPAAWREWLEKHHTAEPEVSVGFYKRDSCRPSITWPEAVDGALCFGWIDGVRHNIDKIRYRIRFTPRKARSIWSAVNIKRVAELQKTGLMQDTGMAAFEKREGDRSGIYAYEQRKGTKLPAEFEKQFRANKTAWKFFEAQPLWYRRTTIWRVISAKKEETRRARLAELIESSERGHTLRALTRLAKTK